MNPLPDYPGVGSLCIKCDFCTFSMESNTVEQGRIVNGKWHMTKVLIPGTYVCSNEKSSEYKVCVVGHLGCVEASQLSGMSEKERQKWLEKASLKGKEEEP